MVLWLDDIVNFIKAEGLRDKLPQNKNIPHQVDELVVRQVCPSMNLCVFMRATVCVPARLSST